MGPRKWRKSRKSEEVEPNPRTFTTRRDGCRLPSSGWAGGTVEAELYRSLLAGGGADEQKPIRRGCEEIRS